MNNWLFLENEAQTTGAISSIDKVVQFITNLLSNPFIKVLVATVVFLLLWWISTTIVKKLRKRSMLHTKDKLITSVLYTTILWSIRIILIVAYAGTVGIDTAGFAALIASGGVALGLAIQGSLSNLAGGIVLVCTKPFQIGDYIESNDISGTVEDMKLFYTNLVTPDNKVVMIPNGVLANSTIINYSKKELRRVDLLFSISYEDNVDMAIEEIKKICIAHELVLKEPAPFVKEIAQAEHAVNITTRVWVKNQDYWTVYYDLMRNVHTMFDEKQITIPYPQIDVHTK
ncbi:MAG: mechanosensitive ion channel [Anaeroplasma bactoclasticum]|nr:mechanosensitive ion channel [Anaeroplasma bactoclasticum]